MSGHELEKLISEWEIFPFVLDIDLYNQELATEETASAHIIALRERTAEFFKSLSLESD